MDDAPPPRDGALTLLKWLVVALTATMLVGMVTLVTLFLTRFPASPPPLPDRLVLPDGVSAQAVTRGAGWIAIVTDGNEILVFDADGETLRQRIAIEVE